jgi:hypothetical protein
MALATYTTCLFGPEVAKLVFAIAGRSGRRLAGRHFFCFVSGHGFIRAEATLHADKPLRYVFPCGAGDLSSKTVPRRLNRLLKKALLR